MVFGFRIYWSLRLRSGQVVYYIDYHNIKIKNENAKMKEIGERWDLMYERWEISAKR
jgi:hypothetical protein